MGHSLKEAEFLSVRNAAAVLDTCTKTVRRYIGLEEDPLPAIRLGVGPHARIRIPRLELIAWLDRRRAQPPVRDIVDEIVGQVLGASDGSV